MTAKHSDVKPLFEDIAQYVTTVQTSASPSQVEPASKKRKLETTQEATGKWDNGANFHNFNDISFSIPQRKKLKLQLGELPSSGIKAVNALGDTECAVKWSDISAIACLPVPEKAQSQYNFCVFSKSKDGSTADQVLWTVPDAVPKEGSVDSSLVGTNLTYKSLLVQQLNNGLSTHKRRVLEPNAQEFVSQIAQAHRKGEKAHHIKAFRGAKDGFLFLLSTGIIWGFKKPLEFFPFDVIDSVSYTSVLQRTFNLNIATRTSSDAEPQEFEFSMIDQADFAGIDGYVKRHGLQDASMAEQRRAKKVNVNGVKGEDGEEDGGQDEEGELEKAAKEAQDLEDEDEEEDENFDPGSEGESEGEGSESEEDERANGDAGGDEEMADEDEDDD